MRRRVIVLRKINGLWQNPNYLPNLSPGFLKRPGRFLSGLRPPRPLCRGSYHRVA